jgi:hypothetical protein
VKHRASDYPPTVNNKGVLLGILQSYAPNRQEQVECAQKIWHLEAQGIGPFIPICMIADGLRYWPWTQYLEE